MGAVIDLVRLADACTAASRWYDELLDGRDGGVEALDDALGRLRDLPVLPGRLGWAVRTVTYADPTARDHLDAAFAVLRDYARDLAPLNDLFDPVPAAADQPTLPGFGPG